MPGTLNIDARTLAAIDDLSLVASGIVEGFLSGLHRSPFLGFSTEFSAYRAYTQGDNLRHIDWKVWGRTDELYVKQFEDNTNLRCQIFLDTSASMDFGAGDANKWALAGACPRRNAPAQASRHHAEEIFQLLVQAQAHLGTHFDEKLFSIVDTLARRGLAVIISDFFAAEASVRELLRRLHAQRQEVIVFHVLSAEETELPYEGEFLFEDLETGEELPVHTDDFRQEYRRRLGAFCDQIKQTCIELEMDYQPLRTDAPLDVALIGYLERRSAM